MYILGLDVFDHQLEQNRSASIAPTHRSDCSVRIVFAVPSALYSSISIIKMMRLGRSFVKSPALMRGKYFLGHSCVALR